MTLWSVGATTATAVTLGTVEAPGEARPSRTSSPLKTTSAAEGEEEEEEGGKVGRASHPAIEASPEPDSIFTDEERLAVAAAIVEAELGSATVSREGG